MKAMTRERKLDLQAAQMAATAAATPEEVTQGEAAIQVVAATLAVVATLEAVIPAAVTQEAEAILVAVGIQEAATLAEVTPADLTMATGTPGTMKRYRN